MVRRLLIEQLEQYPGPWDVVVIGGGATGLGAALESSSRTYKTLLLEQNDFAKGTSSRSTKLVHGGVRYLAQGNLSLVLEALGERGILKQNAPHLVKDQEFIIPCYSWWGIPFYTAGLTLYDLMAGKLRIGRSRPLSRQKTLMMLPGIRSEGLKGGVRYLDCRFDDARLAINLVQSILEQGGLPLNYVKVVDLLKNGERVSGVVAEDQETGKVYEIQARSVINATGVFADNIIKMGDPGAKDLIRPSQGIHLVLERERLSGEGALMIPKTTDKRVLFVIPWHNRVVAGTTDIEKGSVTLEPVPEPLEIDYILDTMRAYFTNPPEKKDILSIFAGLRPLAAPSGGRKRTREISRGHKIEVSGNGLISILGGKWTTYRKMGEDVVNRAAGQSGLPARKSVTRNLRIHGYSGRVDPGESLYWYGDDLMHLHEMIRKDPSMGEVISENLHILRVQVVWAARMELARTLEDCLARRTRALQLDARESMKIAPRVAEILAEELGFSESWKNKQLDSYYSLAKQHLPGMHDPKE